MRRNGVLLRKDNYLQATSSRQYDVRSNYALEQTQLNKKSDGILHMIIYMWYTVSHQLINSHSSCDNDVSRTRRVA